VSVLDTLIGNNIDQDSSFDLEIGLIPSNVSDNDGVVRNRKLYTTLFTLFEIKTIDISKNTAASIVSDYFDKQGEYFEFTFPLDGETYNVRYVGTPTSVEGEGVDSIQGGRRVVTFDLIGYRLTPPAEPEVTDFPYTLVEGTLSSGLEDGVKLDWGDGPLGSPRTRRLYVNPVYNFSFTMVLTLSEWESLYAHYNYNAGSNFLFTDPTTGDSYLVDYTDKLSFKVGEGFNEEGQFIEASINLSGYLYASAETGRWLLADGYWDDGGLWDDSAAWPLD